MSGGAGPLRQITFVGGTSAGFESELRTAVATIPEEVWSPVAAAGVRVYGARLVSDGGILGYDDRDGAYRRVRAGSTGRLVVAEYTQTLAGESLTPDPTATLYHEFGHAGYDHVLSVLERFDLARTARGEAWKVPHGRHGRYATFLMPGPRQFREVFAESFATAMGRNSPGLADFRQYFPKSAEFVEDIIRQRKATP